MAKPTKPVHLCIPTLTRYDLLLQEIESLTKSTLRPDVVSILDNGRRIYASNFPLIWHDFDVQIHQPLVSMGLAEAWNWFIDHVPEERIIANDDLIFAPESIERMVETEGEFVSPLPGQAYSCFILRDSCVSKVGRFDEDISPGYAYFEDCDYSERLVENGLYIHHVECGVRHLGSQTLAASSPEQTNEHHKKFLIAQSNFIKKWGRMPEGKIQQYG
jgi:GT2 family glycosyltransferase